MYNDTLGSFITTHHSKVPYLNCGYCGKNVPTAITYQQLELGHIDINYTIAKNAHTFGLECGCYGKLHRQIAHIQTKMEQKKSRPLEQPVRIKNGN